MHLHACPPRPRLALYANKNSQHLHPRCCFTLLLSSFLLHPAQSWVLLPGSSNHLFSVILLNDPNLKLRRLWKHNFSGKKPTIIPYIRVPSPRLKLLPQTHDFNMKIFKACQACCVLLWVLRGGRLSILPPKDKKNAHVSYKPPRK